ncbi:PKD domain-containing protein [Candidatus Poribacteria bacterium]
MDCRKAKKLINLYLDGEADSSQTQILLSHVDECRKCQARLEEVRALHNTIRSVSDVELPLGFRSSVMEGIRTAESQQFRRSIISRPIIIWGSIAIMALLALTITWRMYDTNEIAPDIPEIQIISPRVDVAINAKSDGPKPEGSAIIITVSQTGLEMSDTYTYSFDWDNDGSYDVLDQTDPSASHTWNDNGIHIVGVGVKDGDGNIHKATTSVEVTDLAPTAEFAWTSEPRDEGSEILFTNASTPSLDPIARWSWDFGDKVGTSMKQNPSYAYRDNGVYKVTLTVTDDDGSSTSKTVTLTVNNVAPSVVAGTDQIVDEGASVTLSSSVFTDPGLGDTHTATIDWGDSIVESGTVASSDFSSPVEADGMVTGKHNYADNGTYEVTVTVTDDDGASASDTLTVTVNNVAPLVLAGADQEVYEGEIVSLASSIFIDPGNDDTHTATIDWGDNTIEAGKVRGVAATPSDLAVGVNGIVANKHVYADNGVYTVSITVTDDDGASASKALAVTVSNVAPSVMAGTDRRVYEGVPVSLASSVLSDAGTLDTHTAVIDWGDGTVEAGTVSGVSSGPSSSILGVSSAIAGSHIYANEGLYTITLKVEDDDGAHNSDTLTMTVDNHPPIVGPIIMPMFGASALVVAVNTTIEPTVSFEDPGGSDTHTTEWDWGDGSNTIVESVDKDRTGFVIGRHTYNTPGVYAVALKVTDDSGDWDKSVFEYVVVYDTNDEFIAGSGQVDSPPNAYISNPEFSGRASFGFISKHKKGEDTPIGNAELRFHVANLDFYSKEYQWSMVNSSDVQFSGRGTINDRGDYGFILTATDGSIGGDGDVDGFRIRIWEEQNVGGVTSDLIVYDNQPGDYDTAPLVASVVLKQKGKAGIPRTIFEYATNSLLANLATKQKEEKGNPRVLRGYAMVAYLATRISTGIRIAMQYLTP